MQRSQFNWRITYALHIVPPRRMSPLQAASFIWWAGGQNFGIDIVSLNPYYDCHRILSKLTDINFQIKVLIADEFELHHRD